MEQQERDGVTATRLPEPAALADKPAEVPSKHLVPVFDVQNVSIFYGSFRAVTDVSLTIDENEITAFIGSSGSGKSTVLRALNRMNDLVPIARMDGEIDYRGESLYAPSVSPVAVRRRIGMVFQKPNPLRPLCPLPPAPFPALDSPVMGDRRVGS
jgi:phosphate transport system ATP-binding protein